MPVRSILIFSFSTTFSYHLCFLLLKNLITPLIVLNLFRYFLGKTILKNNSNQLLVLGMFLFSINASVASKSLPNLRIKGFISSGKWSIWLFSMLNLLFAFFYGVLLEYLWYSFIIVLIFFIFFLECSIVFV